MTVSLMFDDSTTLEQVLVEMGCARFEYNENKDSVSVVNDEDSLQVRVSGSLFNPNSYAQCIFTILLKCLQVCSTHLFQH